MKNSVGCAATRSCSCIDHHVMPYLNTRSLVHAGIRLIRLTVWAIRASKKYYLWKCSCMGTSKKESALVSVTMAKLLLYAPIVILFIAMVDSTFNHRVAIWKSNNFEIWLASEFGVIGYNLYIPYHGQHDDGFHIESSTNASHLPLILPAWFSFSWNRPGGLFQIAKAYSVSIPYWFLILIYLLALQYSSKSTKEVA